MFQITVLIQANKLHNHNFLLILASNKVNSN